MITDLKPEEMAVLEGFTGWEEYYDSVPLPTRISEGHYWDCFTVEMLLRDRILTQYTFADEMRVVFQEFNARFNELEEREKNGEVITDADEEAILNPHREKMLKFHSSEAPADYGICDSPEQVLERWPALAEDPRRFIIFFGEIKKEDQPKHGGWRWHKWGEYIGTKNPQYEYLADEEDIDSVLIFSVIQFKP